MTNIQENANPDLQWYVVHAYSGMEKAVERNIEIIGEAMSRILKSDPTFPIKDARKIVDTRNRIIHGYDSVSAEILWLIVIKYLPELEKEVKTWLETH